LTTENQDSTEAAQTATTPKTITTAEFLLGKFYHNSSLDVHVDNSNPDNSYATQEYGDGTKCDLTGGSRKVTVQYICDDGIAKSRISSIQETSTCEYVMVVATPLICLNEKFQPIQPKLSQIECHPIVNDNGNAKVDGIFMAGVDGQEKKVPATPVTGANHGGIQSSIIDDDEEEEA
jgi:hypothetical protein